MRALWRLASTLGRPYRDLMAATRLGILTGSGPEAGLDLWSKVLSEARQTLGSAYRGDIDAPHVVVLSVPELGHSMELPHTRDLVWEHLRSAAEQLAPQVDAYAIACNTLYLYEPELRELSLDATLISPVQCVRDYWETTGRQKMALLGAAPVTDMSGDTSPYRELADPLALELYDDPARVHALIEAIKLEGGPTPALHAEFTAIVEQLESRFALLACTELPLVADVDVDIELIDVTTLIAKALVNELG